MPINTERPVVAFSKDGTPSLTDFAVLRVLSAKYSKELRAVLEMYDEELKASHINTGDLVELLTINMLTVLTEKNYLPSATLKVQAEALEDAANHIASGVIAFLRAYGQVNPNQPKA